MDVRFHSGELLGWQKLSEILSVLLLYGRLFPWILHNVGFHQGTIIGASGGIYGLLIAFALIWPNQELLFMGFFPLKAKYMVVILMLIIAFSGPGGNIAHMAHLGGAIGGGLYFLYYNKLKSIV